MATDLPFPLNIQAHHSDDTQQHEQFKYKPLKGPQEIRLLHIEPGPEHDSTCAACPILCTISRVSLAANPVYEALSYVWGSTEKSYVVQCVDGSFLPVTANLHAALCRIR